MEALLAAVPDRKIAAFRLERLHEESPAVFDRVVSSPAALRCATALFSYSHFLSEAVLRNPERILQVANSGSFYRVLTAEEYAERLCEFLGADHSGVPESLDLARFRRRQLLRIVLRDILGVAALAEITEEISNLADAILDVTYRRIRGALVARHGEPRLPNGEVCGFSVIALGKLGGGELNYSSDIDLMFVYGGAGESDGARPISNKEF